MEQAEHREPIAGKVGQPESADSLKYAVVSSKELGANCWLPRRFIEGNRCCTVMACNYPEKQTCKAVDAEIAWLHGQRREQEKVYHEKLSQLLAFKK